MLVRRLVGWFTLPVAVVLGVSGCGPDAGSGSAANPSGVVSIGIGEPEHLVPANATDSSGGQVLAALFTPLVTFDTKGKPVEQQAQSITTSDSRVWIIKIKPGYTFHNGEPVTADSYVNSWNFGAYGPNGQNANYYFAKIAGYDAMNPADPKATPRARTLSGLRKLDNLTIQVTLSAPYSDFKAELGYTAFLPLPDAAFDATGRIARGFEDAEIGDGPFRMKGSWAHDQAIQLVRYDAYPGEQPKAGAVDFKIYQDPSTAYADVLANTLDILPDVATPNLPTAAQDFGPRYQHSPQSAFQFIAFPTYDPNYANVNVRKAISMAIDRDQIVKTIFAGSQTAARSFVSPVVPGYRTDTCGAACRYDPAAARQLYGQGHGPTHVQITYNADGGHKEWVEAVCNQLQRNLGVTCTAQPEVKFADLLPKLERKTPGVGMFRLGWVMDYPSMEDYLTPLYGTHGGSNYYGYANPQFDDLVARGSQQPTQDRAIKLYQQAEDLLAKDLPVIPLRFGQNNFVYSTNVAHVAVDLYGYVDLTQVTTSAS
jgi:peptide/nickel transport system substrate-binding protein/oligopeptide transport system substrate-binding protein